jgi:hypothetical protein
MVESSAPVAHLAPRPMADGATDSTANNDEHANGGRKCCLKTKPP